MSRAGALRGIPPASLHALYRPFWRPNLKILLFYLLLLAAGYLAWTATSLWLQLAMYVCMGYLWMGIVTFMHDAMHDILFAARWKNWAFGLFPLIHLVVTYITFKQDLLEHRRPYSIPSEPF